MKNNYIGLMAEDTGTLLIGLLGILKSGNILVPVNPAFPTERICFIVADCRVKVLLTDQFNYDRAQAVAGMVSCLEKVICIDDIDFERRVPAQCAAGFTPGAAALLCDLHFGLHWQTQRSSHFLPQPDSSLIMVQ